MTEIAVRTTAAPELPAIRQQLSAAARQALAAGTADSTRRAYSSDWEGFTVWCATEGFRAMPATAETVTEYVAHLTTTPRPRTGKPYGPSSIQRAIAAIRTAHSAADAPMPSTKGARIVLRGYRAQLAEAKDPAARPKKAAAAVPSKLRELLAGVDRSTLAGKRDAALVLLGFATAARVSELVALDVEDIVRAEHGLDTAVYRKKIKAFTDNAILYGTDPATCPVRAVLAYIDALAAEGRTSGPLFVRINRHGHVAPPLTRHGVVIGDPTGRMTPEAAGDVVARLADRAGLEGQWSGHSLRRGFATAARRAGHDKIRTARVGGWADNSAALDGYMEDADRVTDSPLINIGL
ncbi:site-specific integrase [Streptomyces sp. NPDC008196]|uniref:site-specific integrase n=1 Tax=Streptomyces sp. NPDC008196 TaxID=3364819 RepID=UPI0036E662AB